MWKIAKGNVSFWWDNWPGKGALAKLINFDNAPRSIKVNDFFTNTGWNISSLNDELPSNITNDIKDIQIHPNMNYWPIWTVESTCVFSCKST